MVKPRVYVYWTEDFDERSKPSRIADASFRLLTAIDREESIIPTGRPILIKPNLTFPVERRTAIDTDCCHVDGIVGSLLNRGIPSDQISIAEAGMGGTWEGRNDPNPDRNMGPTFDIAGYSTIADRWGVRLEDSGKMEPYKWVQLAFEYPLGDASLKGHRISQRYLHDFVINAPKLKTHNLLGVTLCVKNEMGTIHINERTLCGLTKQFANMKGRDVEEVFAEVMLSLYKTVMPDFNMVDGHIARMGSGFFDGANFPLGVTVAGKDAYAVDFVCSYLMGFNPQHLLFFQVANKEGFAPGDISDLEVVLVRDGELVAISSRELDSMSSPQGFWVKYHRETEKPSRTLVQVYPKIYRGGVFSRDSELSHEELRLMKPQVKPNEIYLSDWDCRDPQVQRYLRDQLHRSLGHDVDSDLWFGGNKATESPLYRMLSMRHHDNVARALGIDTGAIEEALKYRQGTDHWRYNEIVKSYERADLDKLGGNQEGDLKCEGKPNELPILLKDRDVQSDYDFLVSKRHIVRAELQERADRLVQTLKPYVQEAERVA